jgi:UTP--glucose-1-phosphate uridylyltransferase
MIPTDIRERIESSGLSSATVLQLQNRLRDGTDILQTNLITDPVRVPLKSDYDNATALADPHWLRAVGQRGIEEGRLAILLLNGGMATRFGGVVKGAVDVDDARSFLGLKLLDAMRVSTSEQAPFVVLMNSAATADATRTHLEKNQYFGYPSHRVLAFEQCASIRFTPQGEIFRDGSGQPSFYGPGHGDALYGLKASNLLTTLRDSGVTTVLVSNVDNALATIDPLLFGYHLHGGQRVSIELVDQQPHDRGGAPYWLRDRLQLVEAFRLPPDSAHDGGVFNTNTFWIDLSVFEAPPALTWFSVPKEVNGKPVIQFERLLGEVSSFESSAFIRVPREGESSRFIPVKTPSDLAENRSAVIEAWMRDSK